MLNRLSVNAILKFVIATLSAALVLMLAIGAWDSWRRLTAVNRIASVAEVSAYMFTAMHNLRVDRASGFRDLNAEKAHTSISALLRAAREAEMPALKSALSALENVDIPERQAFAASLGQAIKKLAALHEESVGAFLLPKAQRRQGLAQDHFNETNALLELLDKMSARLTQLVKLEDSFIDQVLELKQLAWLVRNAGGDASVLISNALGGQRLPADAMLKYTASTSRLDTAWALLQDVAAGLPLPARFTEAVAKAKRDYFAPDYADLRMKTLNSLIAGDPPVTVNQAEWSRTSVAKLASLLGVAEAALEVAKEHAAAQRASALKMLWLQLALLAAAVAVGVGMMLLVSRRVTKPLHQIQASMLKLAGGDFGVVVPGLDRKDEIGAMANAVERFKVVADEKARHEADEATRRQQAEAATQAKAAEERAQASEEQAEAFRTLGSG